MFLKDKMLLWHRDYKKYFKKFEILLKIVSKVYFSIKLFVNPLRIIKKISKIFLIFIFLLIYTTFKMIKKTKLKKKVDIETIY